MTDDAREFCEMRVRGQWVRISLSDALHRFDASREKRCIDCHGQVRAHAAATNGMKAHFEHLQAHAGCWPGKPAGQASTPHPKALA